MATTTKTVTKLPAWKALSAHFQKIDRLHLRELFAQEPQRGERLTADAAGLYLDYSKNRITDETLGLLLQLAEQSGLRARIGAMFGGEKINVSEKRAVLHVALRAPKGQSVARPHRQANPQHRQRRHRRLRSGAGDGLRGAQALQRPRDDVPVCLQRGRHRLCRGDPRSRSGGDAVHYLFQDF